MQSLKLNEHCIVAQIEQKGKAGDIIMAFSRLWFNSLINNADPSQYGQKISVKIGDLVALAEHLNAMDKLELEYKQLKASQTPLTEDELVALEQIAFAATPGPWEYDGMHNELTAPWAVGEYWLLASELRTHPGEVISKDNLGHENNANFKHMASFHPGTAMKLLNMIRAMRREIDELRRGEWVAE